MSGRPNHFSEKLLASIKQGLMQTKDLLSKDYTLQDFKRLKSLPKILQQKMAGLKLSSGNIDQGSTPAANQFNYQKIPQLLKVYLISHRTTVTWCVMLLIFLTINAYFISPYAQRKKNQLDMRPAQWSQLQNLIKQTRSTNEAPTTVGLLDDMEVQKIRNILVSRGMKFSVLRLTADNPPKIELQASDAIFPVLLDALDELRTTWRLYPEQLNVVSTNAAGVVNVGGVLIQYHLPSARHADNQVSPPSSSAMSAKVR